MLLTDPGPAGSRKEAGTEVVIHVSVARNGALDVVGATQATKRPPLFEAEEFAQRGRTQSREVGRRRRARCSRSTPAAGEKAKASTHIVVTGGRPPSRCPTCWARPSERGRGGRSADEAGYVRRCPLGCYTEDMEEGAVVASTEPGRRHQAGLGVRRDGQPGEIASRACSCRQRRTTFFQSSGQSRHRRRDLRGGSRHDWTWSTPATAPPAMSVYRDASCETK